MKRTSQVMRIFPCPVKEVWQVVTNNEDYEWRSDIGKVEVAEDGLHFTEYGKNGEQQMQFCITCKDTYQSYAFDMSNRFFEGSWLGEFEEVGTNETKLIFTETIDISNFFVYLISFIFLPLKKIQKQYLNDLHKKLVASKSLYKKTS